MSSVRASSPAKVRARQRRRVRPLIVLSVVIVMLVLIVAACNPMKIASWSAQPAMQEMLGDRGEVSVHIVEPLINVPPMCRIAAEMREDITTAELADVLTRIDETTGDSACTVDSVNWVHPSRITTADWSGVSDEAWTMVAERLLRSEQLTIYRREPEEKEVEDADWIVVLTKLDGEMDAGAAEIREVIAGAAVEKTLGSTEWQLKWKPSKGVPVPHSIWVRADSTPPIEVADALDAIAPIAAAVTAVYAEGDGIADLNDAVHNVVVGVHIADGVTRVRIRLVVNDWTDVAMVENAAEYLSSSAAAAVAGELIAAVRGSGLAADSVSVEVGENLRWGDSVE